MAVKWGILSTADINRKALAGAAESDDVEVVAVGSRDLGRAEEFAASWGIERAYGSYDELLADPGGGGGLHPAAEHDAQRVVDRALEAGKHVLCEKPFSRHVADVERAFAAAERDGQASLGSVHVPASPADGAARRARGEGAIGELRVIRAAFSYSLYDADNIRLRPDVEGGALMDVGCYCVSGARLLGGEPESVVGSAHIGPSGTDWVFTGLMRFPDDVVALFDCGTSLPGRDELEAIGTEGSLFLDDPWHCQRAGDRAAPRRTTSSGSRWRPPTRTGSSSRT